MSGESSTGCKYGAGLYKKGFVYSLKTETPEEDRENRRRKSPPRTRSDFSDSRFVPDQHATK